MIALVLIIPILKITNDYSLDIENQGGLIFDKISNDFYDNINFHIDDELYNNDNDLILTNSQNGEVSEYEIVSISNSNLFEHQFFADTGNGFVQIGTQSNPSINSFDFQNYFAGNASTSYFIKSLYGTNGSNFYFSDTISSIYFDLVNLFDGRVSLSWNHPVQINNIPVNSQYVIEKSSPVTPPTSAIWSPVISLPIDSTNYIDNISVCSSWLNYRVRLITTNCDFVSNLDCLLYTSPSPRDRTRSRMPSSA